MSADPGRKINITIVFTEKTLRELDAMAAAERREDEREPNRSRVVRRLISEEQERQGT